MASSSATDSRHKRRLSFGRIFKKDKEPSHSPQPSSNSNVADSAYASSENEQNRSNSETVPMKNPGDIPGVSGDRNLAVNRTTGDVTDEDTGEVVSTVTTTTTTTTTTITKGGKDSKKQQTVVSTSPGQPQIQEMPADGPSNSRSPAYLSPSNTNNSGSYNSHTPPPPMGPSPDVPYRNPNRKSYENPNRMSYDQPYRYENPYAVSREAINNPVSPVDAQESRHNFSYPSRGNLNEGYAGSEQPTNPRPTSTIGSLKAAAVGLHGVGETLRGTLNNEVDSRFHSRNPEKAAAINAKNQQTMMAGQREMAGLRQQRGLDSTVSPDHNKDLPYLPNQPAYTYHPNAPPNNNPNMNMPNMKENKGYVPPHGTAVEPDRRYAEGPPSEDGGRDWTSYEAAHSYSADYSNSSTDGQSQKRGIRKLIKRRP
ncbi:hypothetical protein LTR37_019156 [Vermiconidia calcicola]|uniref:Uncharacterized protein n=1 Tax=Vermiconidia calcicola TaxID=1690605 RepID=A0ACC3MHY8_9PEZI|nr:hypothetical protein LTR37_019156 [Vermiconidia calcicola]